MGQSQLPGPLTSEMTGDTGTLALTGTPLPGPSGDDAGRPATLELDGGATRHLFEWRSLGFASPPRLVTSDGRHLYRVWGGTSLEHGDPRSAGVFFAFELPASRAHAERLFAIAEFGNACRFVTEFDVPPGTPMWVGQVDPGESVHPDLAEAGEQVFIQNPWAQRLVQIGPATSLEDDLGGAWVYSGPKTGQPGKDAPEGWN